MPTFSFSNRPSQSQRRLPSPTIDMLTGLGDLTLSIKGPSEDLILVPWEHTFPDYLLIQATAIPTWITHVTNVRLEDETLFPNVYHTWPAIKAIQWSVQPDAWNIGPHGITPLDVNLYQFSDVSHVEFTSDFYEGQATVNANEHYAYGGEIFPGTNIDGVCQTQRYFNHGLGTSEVFAKSITLGQRIQAGELCLTVQHKHSTVDYVKTQDVWNFQAKQPLSMAYVSCSYTYHSLNTLLIRFKRNPVPESI